MSLSRNQEQFSLLRPLSHSKSPTLIPLYVRSSVTNYMLSLACRDAGVKDCNYVAKGETEEELWKDGTQHVIKVHDMKAEDVSPEFKESHKPYIKHS